MDINSYNVDWSSIRTNSLEARVTRLEKLVAELHEFVLGPKAPPPNCWDTDPIAEHERRLRQLNEG